MNPKARRRGSFIQLSFDLPHRIHVAHQYPVSAPNGSSVIVYGHEDGLSLLWRGGRPFRTIQRERSTHVPPLKTNGTNPQEAISLESKSDEGSATSAQLHLDEQITRDQQIGCDPLQPYEQVTQVLNLPLGTGVLHLAFPHLRPDLQKSNLGSLPKMLLDRLVLVIGCTDCSVRLITIPLTPPTSESKSILESRISTLGGYSGNGVFQEHMLTFDGRTGHRTIPGGVSLALTMHSTCTPQDTSMNDPADQDTMVSDTSPPAQMRTYPGEEMHENKSMWYFLVASHSNESSGMLIVNRVPVLADGSGIDVEHSIINVPWRKQYLSSPAVFIQFNTLLYPSARHLQLLLADVKGTVRIYDCRPNPEVDPGAWLIELYTTEWGSPTDEIPKRKQILAAQWVLGGKAVAVLLANGEWGIWDLEGSGPRAQRNNDLRQSDPGVDLTKFAISGRVRTSSSAKESVRGTAGNERTSRLAPMTPGTRKVRQETLFTGPALEAEGPIRGGLAATACAEGPSNRADDESLLLWYGESISTIPSLLRYWQMKVKGSGNLLGNGVKIEAKQLNNVELGGQLWNNVTLMSQSPASMHGTNSGSDNQKSVLVAGEYRLVIITTPLAELSVSIKPKPSTRAAADDQALLRKGELDVNGINDVLDNMANG